MATVLDLIKNSLAELGIHATEQTLSSNNQAFCFDRLNRMIDSWKRERRLVYCVDHVTYTFVSSKQLYTIGPATADFTAARPIEIESANVVIVGVDDVRVPLTLIDSKQYAQIAVRAISGIPAQLYYRPTYPNGSLYPYPYPSSGSDKLELFTRAVLDKFTATGDTLSLVPGYEEALTQSLAELLSISFGRELSDRLVASAREARARISQFETPQQDTDYPRDAEEIGMHWDEDARGWV